MTLQKRLPRWGLQFIPRIFLPKDRFAGGYLFWFSGFVIQIPDRRTVCASGAFSIRPKPPTICHKIEAPPTIWFRLARFLLLSFSVFYTFRHFIFGIFILPIQSSDNFFSGIFFCRLYFAGFSGIFIPAFFLPNFILPVFLRAYFSPGSFQKSEIALTKEVNRFST